MAPFSQELEPPPNPGRFTAAAALWARVQGYLTIAALQHDATATWDFLTSDYPLEPWRVAIALAGFAVLGAWLMWVRLQNKIDALQEAIVAATNHSVPEENASPQQYLSEYMFGLRFRWKISANSGEVWDIKTYCPECDFELQADALRQGEPGWMLGVCRRCEYEEKIPCDNPTAMENDVKLETERMIRTGEWKSRIRQMEQQWAQPPIESR